MLINDVKMGEKFKNFKSINSDRKIIDSIKSLAKNNCFF